MREISIRSANHTAAPAAGRGSRRARITPDQAGLPANNARFLFLDPAAPGFYPHWERMAQDVVAMLRTETGRSPPAEPGTPSDDALKLLASWTATLGQVGPSPGRAG